MNRTILTLALLLLAAPLAAQPGAPEPALYPVSRLVRDGGGERLLWGWIDGTGALVRPLALEATWVGPYREGRAAACVPDPEADERCGVLGADGQWLVPPRYDAVATYADGRAAYREGDPEHGRLGFLDRAGRVAVEPTYYGPVESWEVGFSDGLALVALDEDREHLAFIDTTGAFAFVLPDGVVFVDEFHEGLAAAWEGAWPDSRVGYLDRHGRWAIEPWYGAGGPFLEGLAAVTDAYTRQFAYVDVRGDPVLTLPAGFVEGGSFSEGRAAIYGEMGEYLEGWVGVMDREGELVLGPEMLQVGAYSGGLAAALRPEADGSAGRWVLLGADGEVVAETGLYGSDDCDSEAVIRPFEGALAPFTAAWCAEASPPVYGYVDRHGQVVWDDRPGAAGDGRAP